MCPLENFPEKEHDDHDGNLNIVRDKIHARKARAETGPPLNKHQDNIEANGDDGSKGVGPIFEWQQVLEILGLDASSESQGCQTDTDPRELVGDSDQVLQPGPQLTRTD